MVIRHWRNRIVNCRFDSNWISQQDTRTAAELLDFIAEKGKEADAALERLRGLVGNANEG